MKTEKPLSEIGDSYIEVPEKHRYCSAKDVMKGLQDIGPFSETEQKFICNELITTRYRPLHTVHLMVDIEERGHTNVVTTSVKEIAQLIKSLNKIIDIGVEKEPVYITFECDYDEDVGELSFSCLDKTDNNLFDRQAIDSITQLVIYEATTSKSSYGLESLSKSSIS